MRSTYFLGFFVVGAVAAMATGCGDDDDTDGTGGSGGATTSTTTSTTTTTTAPSDGDDTFESAGEITIDGDAVEGELDPIETDLDYYKFSGTAGQAIFIGTDAKPSSDEGDPTYPDLVITLYNAQKEQIAQNDDPYPLPSSSNDSELYTILPETGDFYLLVRECGVAFGEESCAPSTDIVNLDYRLGMFTLDPEDDGVTSDTEPNDDPATNTLSPLEYVSNPSGGYYLTTVFGDFSATSDIDVYSFTVADSPSFDNQVVANFFVPYVPGTDGGNGSTTQIGQVAIVDPDDLTKAVARIDPATGGDIGAPIQPDKEYYLFVKHPGATAGMHDFYFVNHVPTGSNPLEVLEVENNLPATPSALEPSANSAGGTSYFVDGVLPDGTTADEDYFALPLPTGAGATWKVSVSCGAQRSGSGVRDFTFTVLNGDGSELGATYTATETATVDAKVLNQAIPGDVAQGRLLLHISSGTADPDVTSRFYRCGAHFLPPQQQ